jgi:hypothetical protein
LIYLSSPIAREVCAQIICLKRKPNLHALIAGDKGKVVEIFPDFYKVPVKDVK